MERIDRTGEGPQRERVEMPKLQWSWRVVAGTTAAIAGCCVLVVLGVVQYGRGVEVDALGTAPYWTWGDTALVVLALALFAVPVWLFIAAARTATRD